MSFYPLLSWSETTSMGSLWRWNKFWIRNWVVFLAKGSFWRDTKCAIMLNLSIMVSMTQFPSEQGRPMMRSREMWDQEQPRTSRGWRVPTRAWQKGLC